MAFRKLLTPVVLVIGLGASMQQANAITQTYCGLTLCYQWDDAQIAAGPQYFGAVSFVGDSAYWTPSNFEARSQDGVGINSGTNTDSKDATWVFSKIYTISPTNEIVSILAHEEGDYEINYAAGTVSGDLYLRARGLNNLIEGSLIDTDSFDASGTVPLSQWAMNASLTPQATLAQLANNMTVTIQNTLTAFTAPTTPGSELAWIEKKLTLDITTVVPVPAAAWLMGSALGLLGYARRRSGA